MVIILYIYNSIQQKTHSDPYNISINIINSVNMLIIRFRHSDFEPNQTLQNLPLNCLDRYAFYSTITFFILSEQALLLSLV